MVSVGRPAETKALSLDYRFGVAAAQVTKLDFIFAGVDQPALIGTGRRIKYEVSRKRPQVVTVAGYGELRQICSLGRVAVQQQYAAAEFWSGGPSRRSAARAVYIDSDADGA